MREGPTGPILISNRRAHQMRRVYDDRDLRRRLGEQAASDIAAQFGREAVGSILRDRVGDILRPRSTGWADPPRRIVPLAPTSAIG